MTRPSRPPQIPAYGDAEANLNGAGRASKGTPPRLKTEGIRVLGYVGSQIRLRDGQEAFCAIADGGCVRYRPIRDHGGLWLGYEQPDVALQALREVAGG